MPFAYSFWSKLRQISICSSPLPAIIYSPVLSSILISTSGSYWLNFLRPSINFCRSCAFLGRTATLTTGATVNFIPLIVCEVSKVVIVAVLFIKLSRPVRAAVQPQGIASILSCVRTSRIVGCASWVLKRSSLLPSL